MTGYILLRDTEMTESERMTFELANQAMHPVEKEWHFSVLTTFGYMPLTLTAQGFVRGYLWEHPVTKHQMKYNIGVSSDYWTDMETKMTGYWAGLVPHLQSKTVLL